MTPDREKRVRDHLRYWSKTEPTEAAVRVMELLDLWQGLHHLDDEQMRKTDWSNPRFVSLKLGRFVSPGALATHDFDDLTRLVFLAHDLAIRVQMAARSGRYMEIMFHPRERLGPFTQSHPSLEQAIERWRQTHPATGVELEEARAS